MTKQKTDLLWRMLLAPVVFGVPTGIVMTIYEGVTAAFWLSVIVAAVVIFAIGVWRRYERVISVSVGMMLACHGGAKSDPVAWESPPPPRFGLRQPRPG